MAKHALLGASGASRWLTCTPSARLEEQFEETTSTYAEEGTLAHELAELKVRKYFIEPMGTRKFNNQIKKFKEHELWDDEMLGHTETYLDYIQGLAHSYNSKPYVAVEKKVDYSSYVPEGFGTCDCVLMADSTLHVIDLKYGKGVEVSAVDNPQLKLYALGAYLAYSWLYGIRMVKMTIIQPRLNNISEFEMELADLLEWAESIKEKAQRAYKGEGDYVAGEHCKFCRAKAQCRARAEENIKLAGFVNMMPPLISNDEVGELLAKGRDIAKWVKDLEEYALKECLAGREIKGFKAVEGRTSREFTDNDKAIEILKASGVDESMIFERKQLTLAQLEKVVGKKEFNEYVGSMIVKSSGKPALAPENDKREAISNAVKAKDVFSEDIPF